jgi:hypothetical protein
MHTSGVWCLSLGHPTLCALHADVESCHRRCFVLQKSCTGLMLMAEQQRVRCSKAVTLDAEYTIHECSP